MRKRLGDKRVDIWGDTARCVTLPGVTFTPRHDATKRELMRMLSRSNIPATCEVKGLGDEDCNGRMRRRLNEFGDFLTVVVGNTTSCRMMVISCWMQWLPAGWIWWSARLDSTVCTGRLKRVCIKGS